MRKKLIIEQDFKDIDFATDGLPEGEYEQCHFQNCSFSGFDLEDNIFTNCSFSGCDFSLAKLSDTALREVRFKDCKLLGLHFEHCNPFLFEVHFEACQLDLSSFYQRNMPETGFNACSLREVDFTEAVLSGAAFTDCDLADAVFDQTNLEKADFRTAVHYRIDPDNNRLAKARFSPEGLMGLLGKYKIIVG